MLDNIHAQHLNNASNVLNVLLSILCTTIMNHGYAVSKIVETLIISVIKNKSGDATDKHNYRPVVKGAGTSMLHKIDSYSYTTNNQFGFKQNRVTDMCI